MGEFYLPNRFVQGNPEPLDGRSGAHAREPRRTADRRAGPVDRPTGEPWKTADRRAAVSGPRPVD
jgi:hypothetical protein